MMYLMNARGIGLLLHENAVSRLGEFDGEIVKFDACRGVIHIVNKSEKIYRGEPFRGEAVIPGRIIEKIRYEEKIEPNETNEDYILFTNSLHGGLIRFFSDSRLKGIVSEKGGRLAQIANFARSYLSAPVVTGFDIAAKEPLRNIIEDEMIVLLDGNDGTLSPPPEIIGNTDYYYSDGDTASASIVDDEGVEHHILPKDLDSMSKKYLEDFSKVLSPETSSEVLDSLKDHPFRELRIAIVKHGNCPPRVLKHLASDKSRTLRKIVKEVALKNSSLTNEERKEILKTLKTR